MTEKNNSEPVTIAYDGSWYYLVAENELEKAYEFAGRALNRRTRLGKAMACRQLQKLVQLEVDVTIDDTSPEYVHTPPPTMHEVALQINKSE